MTKMSTATTDRAARRAAKKNSPERLSAGATLAWTTTGASGAVNVIVLSYVVFYGTDVLGLNPALLGVLALLSKVLEAVAVIIAGWIVDRSPETRWGKARPYELSIVGVWAATWMLFSTPDMNDVGKAIWVFVALFFANVVFTSLLGANDVLYLARAFRGRVVYAKVASRTGFFTVLAVVAFNVALPILIAQAGTSAPAWSMMILFIAVPMAVIGLGRFIFVKEKYQTEAADVPKVTFRDIIGVLKSNKYIWIVAGITFVSTVASGTGVMIYYFKYLVGDIALMSVVALIPLLVLPSLLIFPWLMKKIGASRTITFGAIAGVLGGIVMIFAGGNLLLVFLASILSSLGILPVTFLAQVLILDNATYNQWSGRRRIESTMGAITAFSQRLGNGIGAGLTGVVLGLTGYDAALAEQPSSAITGIVVVAGVVPAVLWVGVILVMRPYRKFEQMLPTITEELAVVLAGDPDIDAPAVEGEHGTKFAPEPVAADTDAGTSAPASSSPKSSDS
ncbi:Na+/melibiose symporter [Microbacterium sp. cf046]|nr:Na+/melibiose symporter [Microbacterium sp. cf046]